MKSIKRGDIVQPIVSLQGGNLIDGRHKLRAYINLESKFVPMVVAVEPGSGEVKSDEVYRPLIDGLENKGERPGDIHCISCGRVMVQKRRKLICECGRKIIYAENMGWTVPNL